jgi:hypothetical protein
MNNKRKMKKKKELRSVGRNRFGLFICYGWVLTLKFMYWNLISNAMELGGGA